MILNKRPAPAAGSRHLSAAALMSQEIFWSEPVYRT